MPPAAGCPGYGGSARVQVPSGPIRAGSAGPGGVNPADLGLLPAGLLCERPPSKPTVWF